MTPAINGVMLAAGSSLAALIVVKVTIVAALGLAAAWLARRSRAAVRHALLAVTFGAALVLPITSIVAPPVHVTVPVAEVSRVAWPLVVNTTAPISPVTTAADGARVAPAVPQQSSTFSLSVLLLAGWIVGTAVFLVPVMTGVWQIRSLRRSGFPWLDGQSIAKTLALDVGIHRRVEVLLHEALPGPITCGVLGPAIVLPRDAESWAREDLSRAIVHELEHVRRGDSATCCLARAACALYWFHPFVWIAWRKLVLEAERSCDDAVLRRSEATVYADQLVGLAKRLPTAQRSPLLAMASRSDLATRVGAVLDVGQRRGRAGKFSLALACLAAAALVLCLSPLILVAAPQAPSAQAKATFDVVSLKPSTGAPIGAPGSDGGPGTRYPERFATNATLQGLVYRAFGLMDFQQQISGPGWMDKDKFAIDAHVPPGTTKEQFQVMLQNLLVERFKLAVHHETVLLPVYQMVVAKGAVKFKESAPVGEGVAPAPPAAVSDRDGFPVMPLGRPALMANYSVGSNGQQQSRWKAQRQTMEAFARMLSLPTNAGRIVVDKTGLAGTYDFTLFYDIPQPGAAGDTANPSLSIFDALEQQLGLKLIDSKQLFDKIVIDHAERRPNEN